MANGPFRERDVAQLVYVPPLEGGASESDTEEFWGRSLHFMTALREKGREFHVVVLLGERDGIRWNRNAQAPAQIEAERRVFYVTFANTDSGRQLGMMI
ncbi:MAG: hypothetical protein F4209_11945 [Chloroflexi bacterium]|nr:hypothetical protein [Chloroflexota bacterium]MYF23434.1 hypothetical protein [Chloroflexota bacterium]